MPYSTPADLWDFGVPRSAIPNAGQLAPEPPANVTTDAIELDGHGLESGDPVMFRAEAGGSLPAPLAVGTTYYALPLNDSYFQVAATAGGAAISLTTSGSAVVVITPLPVDKAIEYADALIDNMLPAHAVPLTDPVPPIIRMTSAELAAGKLASRCGSISVTLSAAVDAATKRLERWAKGIPLRGTNTAAQTPTNLATSASAPALDSRGYSEFFGLRRGRGGC